MEVNRVISKYDKSTELLVDETSIDEVPFSILKKLFNPPEDDPLLYNSYEVKSDVIDSLKEIISISLELGKFDYYLECFQAKK